MSLDTRASALAAVTASTEGAVAAGESVLRSGGNAFDAAVATALATCVTDPGNTGIGGYGGFMVARTSGGEFIRVDFNTTAPAAVALDQKRGPFPELGPRATSMPTNIAGLARILAEFGTKNWAEVIAPAIALAQDGVVARGSTIPAFLDSQSHPFIQDCFELDWEEIDGKPLLKFRQPALARSLEALAENGSNWFYEGAFAEAACNALRRSGVEVSRNEWASIPETVFVGPPSTLDLNGVTVHAPSLQTSGAPCTLAILAAAAKVAAKTQLESPTGLAELARRMAGVWQYRFSTERGNEIDDAQLTSWIEHAIDYPPGTTPLKKAVGSKAIGHTAHLNTLDRDGALVALTFTHGFLWFGGAWAVDGTGVIMNSGMLSFNWAEPVRRLGRNYAICNMSPAVAEGANGDVLALGCPGGRRIPSRLALVLARHYLSGKGIQQAVSSGRIHVEDGLLAKAEVRVGPEVIRALKDVFPQVGPENVAGYNSPMSAIRVNNAHGIEIALDNRETPAWGGLIAL